MELVIFLAAIATGTACSICSKTMMQLHGVGITGEQEQFTKPIFQTFGMFVGMLFGLVMHWFGKTECARRWRSVEGDAVGLVAHHSPSLQYFSSRFPSPDTTTMKFHRRWCRQTPEESRNMVPYPTKKIRLWRHRRRQTNKRQAEHRFGCTSFSQFPPFLICVRLRSA